MFRMKGLLAAVAVMAAVSGMSAPVLAMGSNTETQSSWRDDLKDAEREVKGQHYEKAIKILAGVIKEQPKNADALNYMGFSHRKLGDYDKAISFYRMALDADPNHQGANEYLGEAFLELNDLPQAEERLAHLNKICGDDCDAYKELKQAVEAFKAGKAPKASNRSYK